LLQYTVGRAKENAIKCLSLYVSRKHCKFIQRDENLAIIDLSVSISFVVYC
jgi:pSer/pThr/pTyr-binding forkhead associated (FHA) protein